MEIKGGKVTCRRNQVSIIRNRKNDNTGELNLKNVIYGLDLSKIYMTHCTSSGQIKCLIEELSVDLERIKHCHCD
jgi:hypothetical protein